MSRLFFALLCLFSFVQVLVVKSHGDHDHDHDDQEVDEDVESDVFVLTDANFEETITQNEFVFVEFYAPWCGHCKRIEPDYEIVAADFKDTGVVIAKVDATVHTAAGEKYAVRGFPTLKLFRKGVPMDYESGRTATEMTQWIKKKTGPPSLHITSSDISDTLLVQTGTKVIAYLTEEQVPAWIALVSGGKVEEFILAHVTDEALFGTRKVGSVVIAKPGEEELVYDGAIEEEPLLKWILAEGFPLVDELAQKIWMRSTATGAPLLALFFNTLDEQANTMIREIATPLKGRVLTSQSTTITLAERWGTSGKKFPTAILVKWKGNEPKMIIFNEETETLTVESCLAFVEAALNGEYQGYKKSEPIPEKNDAPVTVLVGKTFEEVVNDKEKDVFVEYYAPWCGHCKNLAPIWDELGASFEDVETVVIAKIDATANSLPENVDVQGFPTLIYYPADNKEGLPYAGDRDLKSLRKFVLDHASRSSEKEEL